MYNNLLSQQMSIPYKQMGQMETLSERLDSSVIDMGLMDLVSGSPASLQVAVSEQKIGLLEPMPNDSGSQNLAVSSRQMWEQMNPEVGNLGSQHFLNQQIGEVGGVLNNPNSQKLLLPGKRKAEVEPMLNNFMHHHPSMPNKRSTQMLHSPNSPGSGQLSAPSKKVGSMQSMSSTPVQSSYALNKKMVRNESISSKSGSHRVQTPKGRSAQLEPSPKGKNESFEAVRSKMKESLAAALALVCQEQDEDPKEEKNSGGDAAITQQHAQENSQPADLISNPAVAVDRVSENALYTLFSKEYCAAGRPDPQNTSVETSTSEILGNSAETFKVDVEEFQYNSIFPDDVSFSNNVFAKDDLLQGNGLSWALDVDSHLPTTKEVPAAEKPMSVHEGVGGDATKQSAHEIVGGEAAKQSGLSPENLAFKIETELFKLFGGVNKKYKEKGRSLLFNLKDRNNPELRERVMAGEISPKQLCSMTAEELASEELSQWRMAKAEEMAQMIVLPDSDIGIRRLVKKTHKGEYHVEVEKDDGVSVEVSTGTSLTRIQPMKKETDAPPPYETDGARNKESIVAEKSSSESENFSGSLIIPNDGTDFMQGMIVDELKDAEFLPPIVSLDEFMESLNSEPPFENLPVAAGQETPLSGEENSQAGIELVASDLALQDPMDTAPDKVDKVDVKHTELTLDVKSSETRVKQKTSLSGSTSTDEHVWEGILQLSISSLVTVVGLFRSGEKASTKEWPNSLEIKGRVRLDAFEKFLHELPMSRSRAVMVLHLALKEGCCENERAILYEVANSYVSDERLGYAEPTPGVELYLCPTHTRLVDMISNSLSKKNHINNILNKSTDNVLIGVVVWRKVQIKSPNSSSHHKHPPANNQHLTSRRQQEIDKNVNANLASKVPTNPTLTNSEPSIDDDDDIPPGFGPAAARGDDDLPEFNFSGNMNPLTSTLPSPKSSHGSRMTSFTPPSRSVNQIRELINKYGQTGTSTNPKRDVGLGIQPWNDDDDDDDIPEWHPQAPMHGFQHPIPALVGNQHLVTAAPQQPPRQLQNQVTMPMQTPNMMRGPPSLNPYQSPRWMHSSVSHDVQPSNLGHPGINKRHEVPRSRGF